MTNYFYYCRSRDGLSTGNKSGLHTSDPQHTLLYARQARLSAKLRLVANTLVSPILFSAPPASGPFRRGFSGCPVKTTVNKCVTTGKSMPVTGTRVCYTEVPRRRKAGQKPLSMLSCPVFNRPTKNRLSQFCSWSHQKVKNYPPSHFRWVGSCLQKKYSKNFKRKARPWKQKKKSRKK